jgi:hypothetical protein
LAGEAGGVEEVGEDVHALLERALLGGLAVLPVALPGALLGELRERGGEREDRHGDVRVDHDHQGFAADDGLDVGGEPGDRAADDVEQGEQAALGVAAVVEDLAERVAAVVLARGVVRGDHEHEDRLGGDARRSAAVGLRRVAGRGGRFGVGEVGAGLAAQAEGARQPHRRAVAPRPTAIVPKNLRRSMRPVLSTGRQRRVA